MSAQASMRNRVAASLSPVLQRWHRLETRQQRIYGALGALLVFALLYAYVWLPAARERERLATRLPQLSVQLALMKQQADEVLQLNSTSAIAPAPPIAPDIAALQSIFGEGARVSVDSNRAFRVVVPKMGYANWWDRVGDVQARHQLQIVSLNLQALPGNNHEVSVDMLLADRARVGAAPASGVSK